MRSVRKLEWQICLFLAIQGGTAYSQIPQLPASPTPSQNTASPHVEKVIRAPTKDNPDATITETNGLITVDNSVSDRDLKRKLEKLLPKYQGVRDIQVEVEDGVVTLTGHVEDNSTRDRLRDFVRRVQGVNLIINQTKTDAQLLTAQEFAWQQIQEYGDIISRKWLVALLSFAVLVFSMFFARLFNRYSETLLMPLSGNMLLRSVMGSVLASCIVVGGGLLALQILGLTQAVLSFLGLAGVVALAVGFAFRDITENFISSILLGLRRPFRVGDYIEIAGYSGVVKSLSTRATILATLEGNQVRILNSTIYKEILVNKSASTSVRGTFDVMLSYEDSTASAIEAVTRALNELETLERDPPPRVLVEALEPGGVRLRAYFWFPTTGLDGFKLLSDAKLAAKVSLQKIGITPTGAATSFSMTDPLAGRSKRSPGNPVASASPRRISEAQVQDNLRQDSQAADAAASNANGSHVDLMAHALNITDNETMEEGENLLDGKKQDAKDEDRN